MGQAAFTCSTTAGNYGYLQIIENLATNGIDSYTDVLCTPGSGGCKTSNAATASLSISFASSIAVATQTTIGINWPAGSGNTLTLDSISETFNQVESPEPPSFILSGSAFAIFGLFGLRKRRHCHCAPSLDAAGGTVYNSGGTGTTLTTGLTDVYSRDRSSLNSWTRIHG